MTKCNSCALRDAKPCMECSMCMSGDSHFRPIPNAEKKTNADRIRAMSDGELAAVIVKAYNGGDPSFLWCDRKGSCAGEDEEDLVCTDERVLACVVRWLGSPAKEGT